MAGARAGLTFLLDQRIRLMLFCVHSGPFCIQHTCAPRCIQLPTVYALSRGAAVTRGVYNSYTKHPVYALTPDPGQRCSVYVFVYA